MSVRWPWMWLPVIGPIRLSTLLMVCVLAVAITWRRSPFAAVVTVFAWLSAFEVLFQATGAIIHGWSFSQLAWMTAALSGWILLATVRGIFPNRWWLLAFALCWLVWIVAGFDSNSPTVAGTPGFPSSFDLVNEIFNEVSKTLLAVAYLAGALRTLSPTRE